MKLELVAKLNNSANVVDWQNGNCTLEKNPTLALC